LKRNILVIKISFWNKIGSQDWIKHEDKPYFVARGQCPLCHKKYESYKNRSVYGNTGSGMSWAALSLAEKIDPDFGPDKIVHSSKEFTKLLNSGKVKNGGIVIFNELHKE